MFTVKTYFDGKEYKDSYSSMDAAVSKFWSLCARASKAGQVVWIGILTKDGFVLIENAQSLDA